MPNPALLTTKEAADILGVHPSTVNRMIPKHLKPWSTVDGPQRAAMHLFRRSDVERLAARRAA
jgi:excisionase family DNA binding protein